MISRERLQNLFIDMIKIYSPSKDEKEMADWIESYLQKKNIAFKSDQAGSAFGGNGRNIIAHIPGTQNGMSIGFSAHMDQIEPCKNVNPIIDGSIIKTDGTTTLGGDDKAGIAAILEAVNDLLETKSEHRDIYLVFTCSEEISMLGTKNMDLSMLPCKDLVIADATGNTGVIAFKAPAMESVEITFHGKKAHAGIAPEKGINAIVTASKAISEMHIGRIDDETTSNIGRIEGGGATNVVTDFVTVTAEIRSHSMKKLSEEITHMKNCCKNAVKANSGSYEFKNALAYPSLSVDPNCELVKITSKAMESEGIKPELMVIGGGSDANVLAEHGYRSVILGIGMRDVHTVFESVDMDEVLKATRVIRRMMSAD